MYSGGADKILEQQTQGWEDKGTAWELLLRVYAKILQRFHDNAI